MSSSPHLPKEDGGDVLIGTEVGFQHIQTVPYRVQARYKIEYQVLEGYIPASPASEARSYLKVPWTRILTRYISVTVQRRSIMKDVDSY